MRRFATKTLTACAALSLSLAAITVGAVQNPPGCTSVGATALITEYWDINDNGTLEIGTDPVVTAGSKFVGQKILITVTLTQSGNAQCGYQAGTLSIITPAGVTNVVATGAQIPLICDPAVCNPDGVAEATFGPVLYTVAAEDMGRFPEDCPDDIVGPAADKIKSAALYRNGVFSCATTCTASANPEVCSFVEVPCIECTKTCDYPEGEDCFPYGGDVSFKVGVTNCGNVTLTDILVEDDKAGELTTIPSLAPGEGTVVSGSYSPSGTDQELCGPLKDTVTVTGFSEGLGTETSSECSVECDVCTSPCIEITKTCPETVDPGTLSYPVSGIVTNCGNVPLANVTVVDNNGTPGDDTDDTEIDLGSLGIGESKDWEATVTVEPGFCGPIVNTVSVTATDICSDEEVTDDAECTTTIACVPQICIIKEVTCSPDTGICGAGLNYGESATGVVGAAFCYSIIVTNCGVQEGLADITVDDPDIPDVASTFGTFNLAVGESVTNYFQKSFDTEGTYTNTVTAEGVGASSGAAAGPVSDTAVVTVVPISVECQIELVGTVDPPVGCDATLTESGPVGFKLTITNTGEADLDVTVTGLPADLHVCLEDTLVVVEQPIRIAAGDSTVIEGCTDVTCPDGADFDITVQGTAVASETIPCVFDSDGNAVSTEESSCNACVNCQAEGLFCRTTGGGDLIFGTTDELSEPCIDVLTLLSPTNSTLNQLLVKVTHGGQVGAPFAAESCPTLATQLGNPCIKGQWQHTRHYQGKGNPRDVVSAQHAGGPGKGTFDTLHCECLPCCEDPAGVNQPNGNFYGWTNKGDLCNPLDHKVCGPAPRPAPANALIWTGLGQMNQASDTGKKPAEWIVIQVYIEDRSEPGGNHPKGAVLPSDIYSFQAWKTGVQVSKKPDYTKVATDLRLAVAQASCDFLKGIKAGGIPVGSLPGATVTVGGKAVTADITDQGPLYVGNRQIHPTTSATCP